MKNIIKCPICSKVLFIEEKRMICENNHSFDKSKQGYFNLLLNSQTNKVRGDSPEMLIARQNVFEEGFYEEVSNQLNKKILSLLDPQSIIIDIGSGVGYYLNRLEEELENKHLLYGIDISKEGIKESSKVNKNIQYIVGSNHKLPFIDDSIDIMTSVFSPLYQDECRRVLKNDGYLVVVSPNQDHLIEMKKIIYNEIILKEEDRNELDDTLYTKIDSTDVIYNINLNCHEQIKNLLMMTPHYWTSSITGKERLYSLDELNVVINIRIDIYKKLYKKT